MPETTEIIDRARKQLGDLVEQAERAIEDLTAKLETTVLRAQVLRGKIREYEAFIKVAHELRPEKPDDLDFTETIKATAEPEEPVAWIGEMLESVADAAIARLDEEPAAPEPEPAATEAAAPEEWTGHKVTAGDSVGVITAGPPKPERHGPVCHVCGHHPRSHHHRRNCLGESIQVKNPPPAPKPVIVERTPPNIKQAALPPEPPAIQDDPSHPGEGHHIVYEPPMGPVSKGRCTIKPCAFTKYAGNSAHASHRLAAGDDPEQIIKEVEDALATAEA